VKIETLFDVVCAGHLTTLVDTQWKERGGLALVAPAGHLKTSILSALSVYRDVAVCSDMNTQQLAQMRDQISGGGIQTLAILDMQKIYERHAATASNVEGNIRSLVEEGFNHASFENASMNRLKARAVVMFGTTTKHYEAAWPGWVDTGFARRFLWCLYRMERPDELLEAVERWQKLEFGCIPLLQPRSGTIPFLLTEADRRVIRGLMVHQKISGTTPFQFLCKIAAVLQWHYKRTRRGKWQTTLRDFAECLGPQGALLTLPKQAGKARKSKRRK